jgi:hypothetical protein
MTMKMLIASTQLGPAAAYPHDGVPAENPDSQRQSLAEHGPDVAQAAAVSLGRRGPKMRTAAGHGHTVVTHGAEAEDPVWLIPRVVRRVGDRPTNGGIRVSHALSSLPECSRSSAETPLVPEIHGLICNVHREAERLEPLRATLMAPGARAARRPRCADRRRSR